MQWSWAKQGNIMPSRDESASKVARHRERMRAAGLRPVQFWVADTRSAEFAALVRQQCRALRDDPAETAATEFAQAAAKLVDGWK